MYDGLITSIDQRIKRLETTVNGDGSAEPSLRRRMQERLAALEATVDARFDRLEARVRRIESEGDIDREALVIAAVSVLADGSAVVKFEGDPGLCPVKAHLVTSGRQT